MLVRLLRDYVVLGVWHLSGDVVEVLNDDLLVRSGIAEPLPETAALEPPLVRARTKRGRGKTRHA